MAARTDHRGKGFFILHQGWEYVLVLAAVAVTISMLGPLERSINHAIGIDDVVDGYHGLAISAGCGIAAALTLPAIFHRPPAAADA